MIEFKSVYNPRESQTCDCCSKTIEISEDHMCMSGLSRELAFADITIRIHLECWKQIQLREEERKQHRELKR